MADGTFDTWLVEKLTNLNLDEDIYTDYVKGILEDEENEQELKDSLNDILSGVLEEGSSEAAEEIVNVWNKKKRENESISSNGTANISFDDWLVEKFTSLNLDQDVYLDYVKSILDDSESDNEELKESLSDILSGVLESGAFEISSEIVDIWNKSKVQDVTSNGRDCLKKDSIKALINQKTQEQQTKFLSKKSKNVDNELKQQLLAQYGEVSDGEESDDDSEDEVPSTFVNVNAKMVTDKQQQEREKAKKESAEKKVSDKMNLAKDKAKKDDRKDKEKNRTQKGERRAR